jgi:uncharacterized protein YpiB (UPF0302 family)
MLNTKLIKYCNYRITKTNHPTTQQISKYITKENWLAFLKRHVDVVDERKTFIDHPTNADTFTEFVQEAFKLFVQENISKKNVINDVKNLNNMTYDLEIFAADGKNILQQLDIQLLL